MSKGQNKYRQERQERQSAGSVRKGKNQDPGSRRRDRSAGDRSRYRDGSRDRENLRGYAPDDLQRDREAIADDGVEKVFGRNPVLAALRGSREVEHIYIARGPRAL